MGLIEYVGENVVLIAMVVDKEREHIIRARGRGGRGRGEMVKEGGLVVEEGLKWSRKGAW